MITIGTILTVISCEVEITNREAKSLLRADLFLEREELRVHNSNISGLWAEAHTGSKRILTLEDNIVRLDQTGNPGVQFASKFLGAVSKCLDTRQRASVGLVVENERGIETWTMSLTSALDNMFRALEARDLMVQDDQGRSPWEVAQVEGPGAAIEVVLSSRLYPARQARKGLLQWLDKACGPNHRVYLGYPQAVEVLLEMWTHSGGTLSQVWEVISHDPGLGYVPVQEGDPEGDDEGPTRRRRRRKKEGEVTVARAE